MVFGKAIELHLVNGDPDSLTTAKLFNWNALAIRIPRTEVTSSLPEEIENPGVYFLFCGEDVGTDEDKPCTSDKETIVPDRESVYIGESENVKNRLLDHLRDYPDNEKFYWNTAVVFVSRELNKAHIRYLENSLVEIATSCNRYAMLTKATYRNTVLSNAQIVAMKEFIENIKLLINALGYKVLDPLTQRAQDNTNAKDSSTIEDETLFINVGETSAQGVVTSEGFVILKDSKINKNITQGEAYSRITKNRTKAKSSGQVDDCITTTDILFTSPSAAAEFVLGYGASGPATWKTEDGRTLKQLESESIGQSDSSDNL